MSPENPMEKSRIAKKELRLLETIEQLTQENEKLRENEKVAYNYVREKTNELLRVLGTLPLKPEELDNDTLFALDPIGIISGAFTQVLEHQKEINDDLSKAHGEIQAIFDSVGAAIVVVDECLNLKACNVRARDLFFSDTEDFLGKNFRDHVFKARGKSDVCLLDKILKNKKSAEKNDFLYKDRHFHVAGTPIKDKDRNISRIILAYSDITSRKTMEDALLAERERTSSIQNAIQSGFMVIDAQTRSIVDINDYALNLAGFEREQVLGNHCHGFLCPNNKGLCPILDIGQKVGQAECSLVNSAGEKIPILKTVTAIDLAGRRYLLESFVDISARKAAEQALRESEEKYRSLYSTMKEGVVFHKLLYDESGKPVDYVILDANSSSEKLLGLKKKRFVGKKASEVLKIGKPLHLGKFSQVVESGVPTSFETTIASVNKTYRVSVVSPVEGKFATIFDDITERKRAEEEIQRLAYFDTLTNLPNRTLFRDRLGQELYRARRNDGIGAVVFLDMDRFKGINDTLGHSSGDMLLRAVAERLSKTVRERDTVSRLGGDEFAILLAEVSHKHDVAMVAQKILSAFAEPFQLSGHEVSVTSSLGIALYPMDGDDVDTLLKNADTAMYKAKEQGRNSYRFYTADMNAQALERLLLANDLRRGLDRGEFHLCYQPQMNVSTGKMFGMEALLRWEHPDLGIIPPAQFVPLAEETGSILPIGWWALETACTQNKAWHDAGFPPLRVSVNISARQFKQPNLLDKVQEILDKTGLAPQYLELELTETVLMDDARATRRNLRKLKEMGVQTAIDDFGTGYSSLNYLKHFPLDRLKIDQTFVNDITSDPDDAAIAEAIIALAHSLKIKVIAEGVERKEQVMFLHQRQCDEMQGFYFSSPLTAEGFTALLAEDLARKDVCLFQGWPYK